MKLTSIRFFAFSCFIILALYLLPNLLFWQDAQFLIHDNLDSNVVWYKNLAESGNMFSYDKQAIIPQTLGGLPRVYYPSELNFLHLLYFLFPPFIAYNLNIIGLHIIAFVGMYLLLKSFKMLGSEFSEYISLGVALCFSLIPFWPSGCATIAGQPFLLWALLNIYYRRQGALSWLVILLFPFYSSLVLGNLFFFFTLGVLFVGYSVYTKVVKWPVFLAFAALLLVSIIIDQRLFRLFVQSAPVHRDTWITVANSLNLNGVLGISLQVFLKGHYHFFGRVYPIIPVIAFAGFFFTDKRTKKYLISFICLALFLSVASTVRYHSLVIEYLPFFQKLNPRFHSILPLIWFLIAALSISAIFQAQKLGRYLSFAAFVAFIGASFFNLFNRDYQGSEFLENSFYYSFINPENSSNSSFDQYYKIEEFTRLKNEIAIPDDYIICVGFEPEIAQYNGFKTVGGYYGIWPLEYCSKVNKLKNAIGAPCDSRCYFDASHFENGDFSIDRMKELNSSIIVSSQSILNTHFKEVEIATSSETFFIYKVD